MTDLPLWGSTMSALLIILMIVGLITVAAFIVYLVIGSQSSWTNTTAVRFRTAALVAGLICAVLGVLIAFTNE